MSISSNLVGTGRTVCTLFGLAAFALIAAPVIGLPGAIAKTPGKTYCYNRVCHRVLTLAETRRAVGKRRSVIASYYSHCKTDRYNPCGLTSSGARFRPGHADNAASPIYPNGTKLLVWNPSNKRAAVIRIDNAGPYWRNRTLDLSRAAAQRLGFRHRGVARLVVHVLQAPTRRQATYRRYRKYAPVRGYIGRFASLNSALRSVGPTVPTRVFAKVTLPVKNTYVAERRIWLARLVETGPVSVGLVKPTNLRLPVQLARAEFDGWRSIARTKKRRVAALSKTASRTRSPSTKREQRARLKPRNPATSKRSAKPAPKVTATPASSNKAALTKTAVTQPVEKPRPKMIWRQEILDTHSNGA